MGKIRVFFLSAVDWVSFRHGEYADRLETKDPNRPVAMTVGSRASVCYDLVEVKSTMLVR